MSARNKRHNRHNSKLRKALMLRLYKKFPQLFKKNSNPHKPKTFYLSLSATRAKVEEAFRNLELSGDNTDLVGFKKLFSLYRDAKEETATKRNVNDDGSLFPFKNNTEEIVTEPSSVSDICRDYNKGSVRFDFGDDYGNQHEFIELEKELMFGYAWCLKVLRKSFKDSKHRAKDVYMLSTQEDMLKEFAKLN